LSPDEGTKHQHRNAVYQTPHKLETKNNKPLYWTSFESLELEVKTRVAARAAKSRARLLNKRLANTQPVDGMAVTYKRRAAAAKPLANTQQ
jgi:hypothetical protein